MSTKIKTIELFLAASLVTAVGIQTLPVDAHETDQTLSEASQTSLLLAAEGGEGR